MKSKFLLLIALCFVVCSNLQAQDFKYISSEYFDEVKGWTKLQFLSNGNTAMIDVMDEAGISVTIYNTEGKKIAGQKLPIPLMGEDLREITGQGIYEINKELVMFFVAFPKRIPTLYRLRVDVNSAKLIKEEIIAEIPKLSAGAGYAMAFGVDVPGFFVEKDPESDYYGVAVYNTFAKESNERIEVIHYSPEHKEINRAFFKSPNNQFKYLNFTSLYVKSSEYIVVSTFVYNTKASGGEASFIYISKLANSSKEFDHKQLTYSDYFNRVSCKYEYDKVNKVLYPYPCTGRKERRLSVSIHSTVQYY